MPPPLEFGQKTRAEKRAESGRRPFLFLSSPKPGQKSGLNLSEDLFLVSTTVKPRFNGQMRTNDSPLLEKVR